MQTEHDVFISYSNLNRGFADDYSKALRSAGLKVWLDQDGVPGGPESDMALRESRMVLLVVSGPSLKAPHVDREIEFALQLEIPILPVQIQNLNTNVVYADQLKKLDWIDAKGIQTQGKLDEIVAAARQILDARVEPSPVVIETQTSSDIFLSHSNKDKSLADLLWKALKKRGHECWIAPHSIKPSEQWPDAIRRGVRESKILVLLFSANSDASEEVQTELYFAKKFGVPLVSIRLEDKAPEKLEYFIWNKQWISAIEPPLGDQLASVVEQIESVLGQNQVAAAPRPVVEELRVPIPTTRQIEAEIAASNPPIPETAPSQIGTLQGILNSRGHRVARLFNAVREGATDVKATDRYGQTSLHYAAREGEAEVVRLLLERGADVNARDQEQVTPLHRLVHNDKLAQPNVDVDVDLARLLILKGADFDAKDGTGQTPLDYALKLKPTQITQFKSLLELCMEIKQGTKTSNQALREALDKKARQSNNILNAIALGANDVMARDSAGRTALHWAAQENEPELVQLLLSQGADADPRDKFGNTPTMFARRGGYSEMEKLLASAIEAQQKNSPKPRDTVALPQSKHDVFISCARRDSKFADEIYEALQLTQFQIWMARANVDSDWDREDQIEEALRRSRMMLLVVSQASMESWNVQHEIATAAKQGVPILPIQIEDLQPNAFQPLPLKKARWIDAKQDRSQRKFYEILTVARQILNASPLPDAANQNLQSALLGGGRYKSDGIMRAIRDGATDFTFVDQAGRTALHWAAKEGDLEAVKIALENGADVNAISTIGLTPLTWAKTAGSPGDHVLKLLVKHGAR